MSPPRVRKSSPIQSLRRLPSSSPGLADADGGDRVVVLVRRVEILLPARTDDLAADVNVERHLGALLEDDITPGRGNAQLEPPASLLELKPAEAWSGLDRVRLRNLPLPIREHRDRPVPGCGHLGLIEGAGRQDDEVELVFVAVVVGVRLVAVLVPMVVSVVMPMVVVADHEFMGAGRQGVGAGPFEGILRLEKSRVHLRGPAKVESADAEHLVKGQRAVPRPVDPCDGIHPADPGFEAVQFLRGDKVGLVQQDDIGKADLLHRLVARNRGAEGRALHRQR